MVIRRKRSNVTQIEVSVVDEPVVGEPVVGDLILKADHTHAGIKYSRGTNLDNIEISPSAISYLKQYGIV